MFGRVCRALHGRASVTNVASDVLGSSAFNSCTSVWVRAVRFLCCLLTPCRSAILGPSCQNHDSAGVVSPSRRSCKDACFCWDPASVLITTELILICCFCWMVDPDCCPGVSLAWCPCPHRRSAENRKQRCLRMRNNSLFLHV